LIQWRARLASLGQITAPAQRPAMIAAIGVGVFAAAMFLAATLGVAGFRRAFGGEVWRLALAAAGIGLLNGAAWVTWLATGAERVRSKATLGLVVFFLNVSAIAVLALPRGTFSLGYNIDHLSTRPGIEGLWPLGVAALLVTLPALVGARVVRSSVATDLRSGTVEVPRPAIDRRTAVLLIFLLSGAAGLMYEVVWARQLVLVFGNTTQAVSAILTGYFGGLAIGSVVGG